MAIRNGGATILVSWGGYRPNWLAREHQEATMDQDEVTVGAEDDEGGLAMCGRAMRRRTTVLRSCQQRWGGSSGSADVHKVETEAR